MQQLIDDLKSIPGVIGAYVFRQREGIRCSNLPSLFKADRIAEMTRSLIKIHTAGKQSFPDVIEVFINYEESMLFCRQFSTTDYLVAICDPGMNLNVLAMSLNMALEDISGEDETAPSPAVDENAARAMTSPPDKASVSAPPSGADPDILANGPLAQPLQEMSRLLTKVLGPMALIVFDDTVTQWAKGRTPSPSELPQLVQSICREIDDTEKAKRYQELVHSCLPPA